MRWLGDGEVCTDHVSLICRPHDIERVAVAVAEALTDRIRRLGSAGIGSRRCRRRKSFAACWPRWKTATAWLLHVTADSCWLLDLPASWDDYLAGISKSHRKQLRQLERRVLESDRAVWHRARKRFRFGSGLGACWSICTSGVGKAWASRAASPRRRSTIFIARWRSGCSSRGQLRMSWMELDGTPAAAEYHVADGATTYAYQGGVDPDRLEEEPGRLSTILCLRQAIDEGHQRLDFLRGDEPYKAHWRATPRATLNYRVVPNRRLARLRGRVLSVADTLGDWARQSVQSVGISNGELNERHLMFELKGQTQSHAFLERIRTKRLLLFDAASAAAGGDRTRGATPRAGADFVLSPRGRRCPQRWTIRPKAFAAQIHWLRERFDLVSLAEAQARIASGRNRWPTACITFDDGYADNRRFAIPLLLKYHIPFTYFVSTDHVLHGKPFPHDVAAGRPLAVNTLAQLRELAAAGVEIGAHTRSHADLGGPLSADRMYDEIVGLETRIGNRDRQTGSIFCLSLRPARKPVDRGVSHRVRSGLRRRLLGLRRLQLSWRRRVSPAAVPRGRGIHSVRQLDDGRSAESADAIAILTRATFGQDPGEGSRRGAEDAETIPINVEATFPGSAVACELISTSPLYPLRLCERYTNLRQIGLRHEFEVIRNPAFAARYAGGERRRFCSWRTSCSGASALAAAFCSAAG